MKNFIMIISIMAWFNVASQKYYISNSGNDKNKGLTEATAWKTLDKVNKEMKKFSSGDIIAFKGGDKFYGSIVIDKKDGITLTSYGSGKAIITGGQEITGWKNIGNNIWESNVKNQVHQVFQKGTVLSQSRYPKIRSDFTPQKNYYKVSSKSSNTVFRSSNLIGLPNIVGASVQIQSADWKFTSCEIKSFNSGTGQITLSKAPSHPIDVGDYFFVINHVNLLDTNGEWFYDKKSKKLLIKSMSKPVNIVANDLDEIGINIKSSDRVEVENLSIRYYTKSGLKANKSDNLSVKNSEFLYCYEYGILTKSCPKSIITRNYIKGGMMNAISVNEWNITTYASNSIISHNTIFEQGMLKQSTSRNFDIPQTVGLHGSGNLMSYNNIQKIGYNGVRIYGANATVENNFIKDFCLISHDGGAIYSQANEFNGKTVDGAAIQKNIIINRDLGDVWFASGIYNDDKSKNLTVKNNTISDTYYGVFLHNTKGINLEGNNIYNTREDGISLVEDMRGGQGQMVNNKITNNEVFLLKTNVTALKVRNGNWNHYNFGTFNNNKYWNPYFNKMVRLKTKSINGINKTLKEWQGQSKQDKNSKQDNLNWKPETPETRSQLVYNSKNSQQSMALNGVWEDLDGKQYNGNITLQPYSSKILILVKKGTSNIRANAGEDQSICKGENVVLTGSGGKSYVWSTGETTKSITVSPEWTKKYTLTVKDGSLKDTDEIIITVNNVKANAGTDKTIEEGDNVKLTASGGDTYLWSNGETTESIDINPLSTSKFTVTVSKGDCKDTDEVKVTVNKSSNTTISANAGEDQIICKGEDVVLTGSGGKSYVWSTGETTKSITVSPGSTKTYTLTVKDGSLKDTDEIKVTVNNVNADAGTDKTIEEGDRVKLVASGGDTYLWSNGETTKTIDVNPLLTTKYSVTVSKGDCQDTDEAKVTVNKSSTSTITANAGEDQSICSGESVVLTGSGGKSYVWSTGQTTKSITVSPESTKTYTLTVKDGSLKDTDEIIITVNNVKANAGTDKTIEEGDSVTLTASGGDTYLWSNGETTKSIDINPMSTTKFTVTVSMGDCKDTDEVKVTVNKSSNTTIIANAGKDQSICKGDSVVLTGSGGTSYVWSTGETTKSITVSPGSTKTYTLTAKDGSLKDTDEIKVTVNNVLADAGTNKTIEEGDSVNLTASGGDTYLWSNGEATSSISVSPKSTTKYTVTVSKGTCEDTAEAKVTVNKSSNTTITANAGKDQNICSGENVVLTGSGGKSYVWSTGETTKSITVSPESTKTYTLTAKDGSLRDTDEIEVTVNNVKANAGTDKTIEEGDSVKLTASGGDNYLWSTGSTSKSILVNPLTTTKYTVTVISAKCEDKDTVQVHVKAKSNPTHLVVNAFAGDDISICIGEYVTLNGAGGDSYSWSTGDTNKNIKVNPSRTTTYTLTASKGNQTDKDKITVTVENCHITSDLEDDLFINFDVYPNPSTGIININLNQIKNDLNLVLINLNGNVVYSDKLDSNRRELNKQIDISRFAIGVYFVKLFNSNQNMVKKILLI